MSIPCYEQVANILATCRTCRQQVGDVSGKLRTVKLIMTENAGVEKCDTSRIAEVENAGLENAGASVFLTPAFPLPHFQRPPQLV